MSSIVANVPVKRLGGDLKVQNAENINCMLCWWNWYSVCNSYRHRVS